MEFIDFINKYVGGRAGYRVHHGQQGHRVSEGEGADLDKVAVQGLP